MARRERGHLFQGMAEKPGIIKCYLIVATHTILVEEREPTRMRRGQPSFSLHELVPGLGLFQVLNTRHLA